MSIDALTNTYSSATPTSTTGTGLQGSKEEFLKLFMAQLQHQDPFAPTSGADMVAQLAQLSTVEQAKETNSQLADLAAAQSSQASAALSSLVGRECKADAGTFQWQGGAVSAPPLAIESSALMTGASVQITDATGKVVRTIPIADGTKSTTVQWDGKDDKGNTLRAGSYAIAVNGGNTSSAPTAKWTGRIDAVELTDGGPRLRMGGLLLAPADIRTIGNTTPSPPTTNGLSTYGATS